MGASWADIKAKHKAIFEMSKDLDWQEPLSDVGVPGKVRVWRGVPNYAEDWIKSGDLVTTDPDSAWRYAPRGKLIEADVYPHELLYHQRTGREVEFKYIGKHPAGEPVNPQGTVDRYMAR
jgi:hypothetical protein